MGIPILRRTDPGVFGVIFLNLNIPAYPPGTKELRFFYDVNNIFTYAFRYMVVSDSNFAS